MLAALGGAGLVTILLVVLAIAALVFFLKRA